QPTSTARTTARGSLCPRPRLTVRHDEGIRGPLTVISAAPGFGKTTLLQAWRQTESGAACPLAWLALDAADNDPARFLAYLIAALQTVQDGLGDAAPALLQGPHPPAGVAVLTALINDLAGLSRDVALVLDDYHAIETAAIPGFIAAFAGSHRYIVDYLADEVLRQLPEEVRTFLLRTAILDRLCGPLCDAVTGGRDGQAMLERLEQANLFLIPLDQERRWYRYHHLFADVLRYRLQHVQPALEPELHGRASRWYAQQDLSGEAVHHALAARDLVGA